MSMLNFRQIEDLKKLKNIRFEKTEKTKRISNYFKHLSSNKFQEAPKKIDKISKIMRNPKSFESEITTRSDWRLILNHWKYDINFYKIIPIDSQKFYKFNDLFKFTSQRVLDEWADLYFIYYNDIPNLAEISSYLNKRYKSARVTQRTKSITRKRKENCDDLFTEKAFDIILGDAEMRRDLEMSLIIEKIKEQYGIPDGEFINALLMHLYIFQIKKLSPNDDSRHPVIEGLIDSKDYEKKMKENWSYGNEVVRVFIEKMLHENRISAYWIKCILRILGDPRDRDQLSEYGSKWGRMSRTERRAMDKWLVHLDFELFLQATQFAPDREKFIRDMINNGIVERTRIIINPVDLTRLSNYVRSNEININYARLKDADERSLIYLELKDGNDQSFHIIEGTQSTSIYIFLKEPVSGISEFKSFSIQSLLSYAKARVDHNSRRWVDDFWFQMRKLGYKELAN
jgi:hypothetical protein